MPSRKEFIKTTGVLTAALLLKRENIFASYFTEYESKRPPLAARHFTSDAVESVIAEIKAGVKNKENINLGSLNLLCTTPRPDGRGPTTARKF